MRAILLSPSLLARYTRANGGNAMDRPTDDYIVRALADEEQHEQDARPLRGFAIGRCVSMCLWLAIAAAAWPLLRAVLGGAR